jgi:hypothetical protein
MTNIPKLVISAILAVVLGIASYATYVYLVPQEEPPDLTPIQWVLAKRAVEDWGANLNLPKNKKLDTVTAPILEGDKGPDLAKILKPELLERNLTLATASSLKSDNPEMTRWFETVFGNEAGQWADARWQKAGVQAFVRGRADFLDVENHDVLRLEVRIEDSVTGASINAQVIETKIERSLFNLDYYRLSVAEVGVGWRIFLWIVVLLGLPLLIYPVAEKALKKGSNASNVSLWLGLTLADMLLVFALSGFYSPGFFGGIGLLLALALTLFYNYGILTEIDDLRK